MKFLMSVRDRFRNARQRQYSKLAQRLDAYFEKHHVEMPPQRLPEGGLFIQYDGEPEPRAYGSTRSRPNPPHEKDLS